jgi:hypothetical protein
MLRFARDDRGEFSDDKLIFTNETPLSHNLLDKTIRERIGRLLETDYFSSHDCATVLTCMFDNIEFVSRDDGTWPEKGGGVFCINMTDIADHLFAGTTPDHAPVAVPQRSVQCCSTCFPNGNI